MTLKTSFNRVFACLCACVIFLFLLLFSSVSSVRALDVPSTGSASLDWAVSQGISAGTSAVETAILTQYSSLDPTTLAILEAELGFSYALGQDVWAMQQGFENFSTTGTSFYVLSGVSNVTLSDGSIDLCTSTLTLSTNSFCGRSGHGVYFCWRPESGHIPSVNLRSGNAQYLLGNPPSTWTSYSGYFDTLSPSTTQSKWGSCLVYWSSSDVPTLTPTYYKSTTSSGGAVVSFTMNSFLCSAVTDPIAVDTSSDDVPSIMAAYKSALASQLGVTVEDVDEVWTLPDDIPEDPTEPAGSGCCCQPFVLPSEWVQSDVVELETDHYTIPYTDLVREPYNYLIYGATNMPPPVTPADDAKKALQTKTTTKQATRSGDPIKDLKDIDPEMYEALFDYSALLQDILDRSGVLPYWAILMAAGALFLII